MELKSCPFCGGKAQVVVDDETEELFIIQCTKCKAQTAEYEYFEDADRAWNRRTEQENGMSREYCFKFKCASHGNCELEEEENCAGCGFL